jgi:hypothetical protein
VDPLSVVGMSPAFTRSGSPANLQSAPGATGAAAARLQAAPEEQAVERPGAHVLHQQMGSQIMSMLLGLMGNQRQDG